MKISQRELVESAALNGIASDIADNLWRTLEERAQWRPRFDLVHVLYYAGALIVILAMSVFLTTAWSKIGASALFSFAGLYAVLFLMLAEWMKGRPGLSVPTGLVATMAVVMVPLMIYALQEWFHLWPADQLPGTYHNFYAWVRSMWLQMELWTLIAGMLIFWRYQYPFIVLPIAVCLWFVSMDLAPLIVGSYPDLLNHATASKEEKDAYWATVTTLLNLRKWVSLFFGAAMIALSYSIDRRTKQDYAFWIYLFGLMAFWGGLTTMDSTNELGKFIYALINFGLLGLGIFLGRRAFLVFGALGITSYLGHLAFKIFENSLFFPVALVAFGLSMIGLGVFFYRHGKTWEAKIISSLPTWMIGLRPQHRELPEIDRPV
ncbi:hypothetical protein [Magnetovibrio blakemorei]|uniref:DUF2157 domain-containing protein n=1 Tax=Magnetovibrio blakemorei TaxID=28181 RepID=A0A1E5QCX8_9PROT|nr:hypothetical protein [Magnetovibrio blakemorei]OEJ69601.1 hypothetical protein BEN30_01820 [Magnetovibrio blakemorei]